jgi:hypothetical protein
LITRDTPSSSTRFNQGREPWYYNQLIARCVEFDTDEFDGTVFPVLLMMHPSGETVRVVVSSDEEGNGAGFLFVEEAK